MPDEEKPVRLTHHALSQIFFRGTTEAEVVNTVRSSPWGPAELGRLECRRNYPFQAEWNNITYRTKQVRPIFVEEDDEIVVVTVYVYYF